MTNRAVVESKPTFLRKATLVRLVKYHRRQAVKPVEKQVKAAH